MNFKRLLWGALCWGVVAAAGADPLPFNLTLYGLYGAPTQPDALVRNNYDGLGFGGQFEWNPSYYASLGLGYEHSDFYGSTPVSAGTLGLEGKFYLAAFIRDFAPYLSAGMGLNLGSAGWTGPAGWQVGLGEKVPFIGPTLLDIGFDYHWMDAPGAFEFGALHAGVGFAFDIAGGPPAPQAPVPTPQASPAVSLTPSVTATVTPTGSPEASPTVTPTQTATATPGMESPATATPTPEDLQEPTPEATEAPAVSKMKKYYHLGVHHFLKRQYTSALADLKICVGIQDPKVPSYYYAEAYATMGVIYHFHRTYAGHLDLARKYYRKALKIDPRTKSAKKYMAELDRAGAKTPPAPMDASPTPQ
ncbi:MAG TPA: hypothetical protein VFR02_08360 [bacterium]|nr:hypothetical protein [bacterium]